jgi:hypothetical protein
MAASWPAGTPCEFLFGGKWYRAISRGIVGEELELAEVRARGVTTPVPLKEVASRVAAMDTHLSWSDSDERKLTGGARPEKKKRPLSPERQEEVAPKQKQSASKKKAAALPKQPAAAPPKQPAAAPPKQPAAAPPKQPAAAPPKQPAAAPPKQPAAAPPKQPAPQKKKAPESRPPRSVSAESEPNPVATGLATGADGDGDRPRRAAAKRGASAMRNSMKEDGRDSMDGLSSEDEDEDGAQRAAQRKKRVAAAATRRVPRRKAERDDDEAEGEGESEEEDASEVSEYEASSDDGAPRRRSKGKGKSKVKREGRGKEGHAADDSGDRPQQSLSKEDRAAEAKEWAAIQAAPPPPQWKVPAEAPGFSKVRELRSRRGHLSQWHAGTASKRSNFQPPFLDSPFDINDRGVAHIVTGQARKLRGLLEEALRTGELPPIALQTLCSGTDAPAIALSLVRKELQPALSERGLALSVEHTMSCENEPFKQAYIARNFPGVTLFNDVVELAAAAEAAAGTALAGRATTSFGGEREIPRAKPGQRSLLVAGTSCKDLSALNPAPLVIEGCNPTVQACNPSNSRLQPY